MKNKAMDVRHFETLNRVPFRCHSRVAASSWLTLLFSLTAASAPSHPTQEIYPASEEKAQKIELQQEAGKKQNLVIKKKNNPTKNSNHTKSLPQKQSHTLQSSVGPTSNEDANVIWQEGSTQADLRHCSVAIPSLERLIHRYPAHEHATEAHLLLGQCLMNEKRYKEALPVLRYAVEANGVTLSGTKARIEYTRCLLSLKKGSEALLSAHQLIDRHPIKEQGIDLYRTALLLTTQAQISLNRDSEAEAALSSFDHSVLPDQPVPNHSLLFESSLLRLDLKLRSCARYPSAKTLKEEQARDQILRRGDCLVQALTLAEKAAVETDANEIKVIREKLNRAISQYQNVCLAPPQAPEKKTIEQRKMYREELVALLESECANRINLIKSFLEQK